MISLVAAYPFLIVEYGFLLSAFACLAVGISFAPDPRLSRLVWTVAALAAIAGVVQYLIVNDAVFDSSFMYDGNLMFSSVSCFLKVVSLVALAALSISGACVGLSIGYEYIVLMVFGVSGGLFVMSSDHMVFILIFLEAQSIIGYAVAAYSRTTLRGTEASIKYFLIGSVVSSSVVFGFVMVFFLTGSFSMNDAASAVYTNNFFKLCLDNYVVSACGSMFVSIGFIFKMGCFPFHNWTVDVYRDAEYPIIGYFSSIPKLSVISLMVGPFYCLVSSSGAILMVSALSSLFISAYWGVLRSGLKTLIAYSTIASSAYIVFTVGLSAGEGSSFFVTSDLAMQVSILSQVVLYSATVTILCVVLQSVGWSTASIERLRYFSILPARLRIFMLAVILNLAGLPPLMGFFCKVLILGYSSSSQTFVVAGFLFAALSLIIQFLYLRVFAYSFVESPVSNRYSFEDVNFDGGDLLRSSAFSYAVIVPYIFLALVAPIFIVLS